LARREEEVMRQAGVAAALVVLLLSGCIGIIDHGTRGGKITKVGAVNTAKGDKKDDVLNKLGEPDDISVDAQGGESWTYRSCSGMYIIVFGVFDYFTMRAHFNNTGVVDRIWVDQMGHDIFVLDNFGVGSLEPHY
jgi:outer membrane protein assembly factor BamE (lipoprotein component of BamABCDE complex)